MLGGDLPHEAAHKADGGFGGGGFGFQPAAAGQAAEHEAAGARALDIDKFFQKAAGGITGVALGGFDAYQAVAAVDNVFKLQIMAFVKPEFLARLEGFSLFERARLPGFAFAADKGGTIGLDIGFDAGVLIPDLMGLF